MPDGPTAPDHHAHQRALDLLRAGTGNPNATFRDGQWEAIRHLVDGDGRVDIAIANQVTTSLTTLQAADALRDQLIAHQKQFFEVVLSNSQSIQVSVVAQRFPQASWLHQVIQHFR